VDIFFIISVISMRFAELKERWRGLFAGSRWQVNGINCTRKMLPTSSTLQQAEWERQVQEHHLRNKYGIAAMMAGEDG